MSQLTIYLADDLVRELKARALREHTSVSACLAALVRRETTRVEWPESFLESFGAWKGARIREPAELAHERRARLK